MADLIQAFGLHQRLMQCRKSAKFLYGAEYRARMEEYGNVIKAVSERESIELIPAAMKIADRPDLSGVTLLTLWAALVELLEPTPDEINAEVCP